MALRKGRSLLRLRIKQAGLNQRKFAKLLGVGEPFVSMIISGERDFTHERVVNAAHILGCRVEDLNDWDEVPLSELQKGDE